MVDISPGTLQPLSAIGQYKARYGVPADHAECVRIRNFHFDPIPLDDFIECVSLRERMSGQKVELALLLHPETGQVCAFAYYIVMGTSMFFVEEAVHPDLKQASIVQQCLDLLVAFAVALGAQKITFYMQDKKHHPAAYLRKIGFDRIVGEHEVNKAVYQPKQGHALFVKRASSLESVPDGTRRGKTGPQKALSVCDDARVDES